MFDFAQNLLDYSKKKGFNQLEVYIEKYIEKSFDLKNESDYSKSLSETIGVALRLIKDDYIFFVNSTLNDEKKVEDMIDNVSSMSFSKKIDAQILSKADDEFSFKEVNEYDESKIKEAIYEMSFAAKNFDKRIQQVKSSSVNINEKYIWVLNSFGLKAHQAYNIVDSQVSVLAKDKIEEMGWCDEKGFSLNDIDFVNIAKVASQRAVEKLSPSSFSTKKLSVVLSNEVMSYMLRYFFNIFSAQSVIDKTTKLEIGKKAFSSSVTIVDDNIAKGGVKFFIDEEGVQKKPTIVMQNGELKTFLHNTYTSGKLNCQNTANAKRFGFVNPVKVGPANFYLKPSNESLEDLLSTVDGFYITEIMGMHMANPISGDFSLGVNGFLIESGQKIKYIKASTFTDNFYNILNKVIKVANNVYFSGSVGSPSVWVADCIIGGED
ncbi:TldE protein, part of TldE/TldD proteolytic complex [Desulfurella amilsii]|uniref:TldE protein, part of TldE/TldD proteolytic complex n=1 Tax=Desulfurella amilsii TaxID=1562698 RepID=A0A1X4Y010_9BACT|nr:TldD/PmbA family protein [Desulfurella amilsii]OSS43131.1 TldE protein, part of TldE/TldD proteolytic complex [Desulfurella amilsii]